MNETHIDSASQLAAVTIQVKPDLLALTERQHRNFERKIDKSGGPDACWPWTGARRKDGFDYGIFSISGKIRMSHRIAFRIKNGFFDCGLKVCHSCDNPPCCNPAHLWLGVQADNIADMDRKGRRNMPKGAANGTKTKPWTRPMGEDNAESKLTEELVARIKSEYVPRIVSMSYLANLFNVKKCTIWKVLRNKTWKHVA